MPVVGVALVLGMLLASCQVPAAGRAPKPVLAEPPLDAPYPRQAGLEVVVDEGGCHLVDAPSAAGDAAALAGDLDLRGDPAFDPNALPAEVRCWYEELWSVIVDPDRAREVTASAASDDLYTYARPLQTHVVALLTAFRVTGDLALLDEVDRLAQHMRAALEDGWRGPAAADRDGTDGYLNWVWRGSDSRQYAGRDVHETDEMRTHALVAEMAYAFAVNADLESPHGVDYAERAAFWRTYLVDHFEAKWRARSGAPWPEFPFLSRPHMHETVAFVRYHHYMAALTGKDAYAREAERLTEIVFGNMREASTASGPALVWPRSILSEGGQVDYLMPTTYARYVMSDAVDLHLEGVGRWADASVPTEMARSLAWFVMDDGADSFARDVGGGEARAGIRPAPESWVRFTPAKYVVSPYALVTAWDDSGRVAEVSRAVYSAERAARRDVFIPAGLMLASALAP